jgi:hypothetical protein
MKKNDTQKKPPGPKPGVLKIEGNWQDAVKKSLSVKKPAKSSTGLERAAVSHPV